MARLLIVDDRASNRELLRTALEHAGHEIREAEDGASSLDLMREWHPDLVLMDIQMPVMDGLTFLKALRADPGGDAPIVIFCTTENDLTAISEAIGAGANEYIMKPFDSEIVQSKFAEVGLVELV